MNRRYTNNQTSKRSCCVTIFLGLLCSYQVGLAVAATPGTPGPGDRLPLGAGRPITEIELFELEAIDVSSLLAEDAIRARDSVPSPFRFATPIAVEIDSVASGSWTDLDNGDHVWRLRIRSPGALNINLWFSRFEPPEGAALWLYSVGDSAPVGPYRRSDANAVGHLWSPVIIGDEVVVELYLPQSNGDDPGIRIGAVNHGYRSFGSDFEDKQGSCHIDVGCPRADPFRDLARAVARYTVTGTTMCSGTLLNNVAGDFTPFFLTAAHCGVNDVTDVSVVTYWNSTSQTCGQLGGGSLANSLSGSTFLAGYSPSDVTLIRLDDSPPPSWGPYFAGWDASGSGAESVIAIHHPGGSEKAAAFDTDPIVSVSLSLTDPTETHWLISEWEEGATESGSSGSCIFDRASARCLGVLTTGTSSCEDPRGLDVFGKMAMAWEGGGTPETRLRDWLAAGTQTTSVAGADPADPSGDPPLASCEETDTSLCLAGGRFEVIIDWVTATGQGTAITAELRTDDSGLFYFFSDDNLEVLIKVLDGCAINNHYWVFYGAATDVGFEVTVTDTSTNEIKTYSNTGGVAADAITDTSAFATCS